MMSRTLTHTVRFVCLWSNLFTITIENLLHFLKYFDDKVNSMKNFPLGFVKVWSTLLFFGFLNKCGKIWLRKDRTNILGSAILNLVTWPASLVPRLLVYKNVTGIVQMCMSIVQQQNSRRRWRKHKTWCITEQTEHSMICINSCNWFSCR